MPFYNVLTRQLVPDGLYLIQQFRPEKGVTHSAILDVGNLSSLSPLAWSQPSVVDLSPAGFQILPLGQTGVWTLVRPLRNQAAATRRIREVAANPQRYSVISNNCEHLVEYVETGEAHSQSVTNTVLFVGVSVLGLVALSSLSDAA